MTQKNKIRSGWSGRVPIVKSQGFVDWTIIRCFVNSKTGKLGTKSRVYIFWARREKKGNVISCSGRGTCSKETIPLDQSDRAWGSWRRLKETDGPVLSDALSLGWMQERPYVEIVSDIVSDISIWISTHRGIRRKRFPFPISQCMNNELNPLAHRINHSL